MVKTHTPEHTYGRTPKLKRMTTSWIAVNYHTTFKVNPHINLQDII